MNLDLERYKAVIFDMDGTLIDTMPAHLDTWKKVAEKYEFPFDRDWMHSLGGKPSPAIVEEINARYGLSIDAQQAAKYKMALFQSLNEQHPIIAHTFEVLNRVYGCKKIALGTGSARKNALKLLDKHQLVSLFDSIVTSSDVTNFKPCPDTFLLAATNMGIAAEDCVVFEDTNLGKMAAHAAGMDCYMVVGDRFEFHPLSQ
jgi:beta-phosphoglucomutase family hydrolase